MLKFGIIALLVAAIAVPSVLFATQATRTTGEARIQAFKHEDGRIEFALQVREGDDWSERILPSGRFLGANAPTGKWLNSTPIDTVPYIPIEGGHGWYKISKQLTEPGQLVYSANRESYSHEGGRLSTTVRLLADEAQGPANPRVEFEVRCLEREWQWSKTEQAELQVRFWVYTDDSVVTPAHVDVQSWFEPGYNPNYNLHPRRPPTL